MSSDSQSSNPKNIKNRGKDSRGDLKGKIAYPQEFHREFPQAPDAERGILASIWLAPEDVLNLCGEKGVTADAFYLPAHQTLYKAFYEIRESNRPIEFITVAQYLRDRNLLDLIGGPAYLNELSVLLPSAAYVTHYIDDLLSKHVLRRIIGVCTTFAQRSYDEQDQPSVLLDQVEKEIFDIAKDRFKEKAPAMKDMVMRAIADIQKLYDSRGKITGLETGFKNFDSMTDGLHGSEMIVIAARPSMGKCLVADSEILLTDGRLATIEEIARAKHANLLTLGKDWQFHATQPSAFVDDGMKPAFRVTTRLGRTVEATMPHPFLTPDGWKPLAELKPGHHIAVPRELSIFGNKPVPEWQVKTLAYLLGDGGLSDGSPEFTNQNPAVRADYIDAVRSFGGLQVRETLDGVRTPTVHVASCADALSARRRSFGEKLATLLASSGRSRRQVALAAGVCQSSLTQWTAGACLPSEEVISRLCATMSADPRALLGEGETHQRKNALNPLAQWIAKLGLMDCKAATKFVPDFVSELPREEMALFLNRLFATDGWATVLASGQTQLGFASASERLIRRVQHLLLRFGIIASLRSRKVAYRDTRRQAWQLDITDALSIRRFVAEIGIFGKEEAVAKVAAAVEARRYQTNRDLVPVGVWKNIERAKGTESWSALAKRAGLKGHTNIHAGRRSLSRARLQTIAGALADQELEALAGSAVYWDTIVSIEPLGLKQVYDLTIPETHNFVANDICVHNTAFAMNIAEHVAVELGKPVAVFSLEMSAQQLVQRLLCSLAKVNLGSIRNGFLSERDFPALMAAAEKLAKSKILIDDTSSIEILELRSKARRMKSKDDIAAIFIDYLQLIRSPDHSDNRQLEIAAISANLKALAKELNIPIIVLAQLNRNPEQRTGESKGRPRLSDLRESGSIEQDADLVGLLVREEYYAENDEDRETSKGKATLIIAKQRNGPVGDVALTFLKEFTRFEDRAEEPEPQG